jgi:Mg-chelatase subunit ChlI
VRDPYSERVIAALNAVAAKELDEEDSIRQDQEKMIFLARRVQQLDAERQRLQDICAQLPTSKEGCGASGEENSTSSSSSSAAAADPNHSGNHSNTEKVAALLRSCQSSLYE